MWYEGIMVQSEPIFQYLHDGTEKSMRTSDRVAFVRAKIWSRDLHNTRQGVLY
jgi:hypothetical protein